MFEWLGDLLSGLGDAIGTTIGKITNKLASSIFELMFKWIYEMIYNAIADFFTMMGNLGADIFNLSWIQATIQLFTLFGWALYVAGIVVAVFEIAMEYQKGRASPKDAAINILKEGLRLIA